MTNEDVNYHDLNAELNLYGKKGEIQFDKDKEATRQYFLQHVNQNTVFFHSLKEKLEYLFENDYYEKEVFDQYSFDFVKSLFQQAYGQRFRFKSFLGAFKFYSSYALKTFDGKRYLERYEDRIATTALYLAQGDEKLARSYVDEMITNRYQPATPTFLNAGKKQRGELVSCFLINTTDDLESIARNITNALQLSKRGGGVAINLTNLRESGAPIKKIENQSSGVVPVMKMFEDAFSYANQLGARQGAGAVYLNVHHPDIIQFLDTKRENADEKIRIKTLSIGLVVPDITFQLAKKNEDMYLFSPYDVEREYGKPFSEINVSEEYYNLVENENITKTKISARKLFTTIAELQFESGYPYLMFEDTANAESNVEGKVQMSNLCVTGDTRLLTSEGYKRVEDLYKSQEDITVQADNRAISFDSRKNYMSNEKSTKMFKTAENADIFRVTTNEGYELKATEWHKMYVERGGEIVKIPLAELVVGDKILVQGSESVSHAEDDMRDLGYVSGVIAADGTYGVRRNGTYSPRIDLYGDKAEFIDDIEAAVGRILDQRDVKHHSANSSPRFVESEHSNRVSLSSSELGYALEEVGYSRDNKLSVPDFVFQGSKGTKIAFISGVWQMDGTITGSVKSKVKSAELGSTSKSFLQQIQILLADLGVHSRIYAGRKESVNSLPDGRGGYSDYNCKEMWSLRVNNYVNLLKFVPMVNWRKKHRDKWNELTSETTKSPYQVKTGYATVSDIEFAGVEDVYDVTVDNGNSVVFNGIVTGNCSEILQTSTTSTFKESGSYQKIGTDISCNLGSLNVANAMKSPDFEKTIEMGVRALTAVSDLSNISSVPSIDKGNKQSHAIGLGQMNLAGYFGTQKMMYGDEESLDFTNIYFYSVLFYALKASNKIAKEKKEKFVGFENSKYASGEFFQKFIDNPQTPKTAKVKKIIKNSSIQVPTSEDWSKLAKDVKKHGLYNKYIQAVPPTGSISYISDSTASIHPITAKIEARKEGKIGRVYYAAPGMTNDNQDYFVDAYTIGPNALIDVYSVATKYVDQGLSCTLFFKDTATTRDLNKAYIYAWSKGLKTLYYSRVQRSSIAGSNMDESLCVSCSL